MASAMPGEAVGVSWENEDPAVRETAQKELAEPEHAERGGYLPTIREGHHCGRDSSCR
jgi:hypothetical protein